MTSEKFNSQQYHDVVYGQVEIPREIWPLVESPEITRIKGVSLDAAPSFFINTGINDSRFNHSLGVMHLAQIVANKPEFSDISLDLVVASLAHDAGSTPFSHLGEIFLQRELGIGHEQFVKDMLTDSEFADLATRLGANMDNVIALIEGDHDPYGPLLAAEIDLDNMDNTLRYGLKAGILNKILYSPEKLANAFTMVNGRVSLLLLDLRIINAWNNCREKVYEYVYGDIHLGVVAFLQLALHFGWQNEVFDRTFFYMNDYHALADLEGSRVKVESIDYILTKLWQSRFPKCAYDFETTEPTKNLLERVKDPNSRFELAELISQELQLDPGRVSIYLGKKRGQKAISTPIFDVKGNRLNYIPPQGTDKWGIKVFTYEDQIDEKQISEIVSEFK